MTKTFDVIPIEDYAVVVDKETDILRGDWICDRGKFVDRIQVLHKKDGEFVMGAGAEDCYKIIASIYRKIDDSIPVIEMPDKVADEALKHVLSLPNSDHLAYWVQELIQNAYKAAHSKYKYTEEDMKRAWEMGYDFCEKGDGNLIDYLQKNKLPKQVELEIDGEKEVENYYKDGLISNPQYGRLKITNPAQNTITPVNVIYE